MLEPSTDRALGGGEHFGVPALQVEVDRDEVEVPAGRADGALDGALEIGDALVPVAAHRQPPAELGHGVGVVRVERERLALDALGLGEVTEVEMDRGEGLKRQHAGPVEGDRMRRGVERLLEGAPGVGIRHIAEPRGVEVQPSEHGPGLGIVGVATHRRLEAAEDRRVELGREGAPVLVGAQHAGVARHARLGFAGQAGRHVVVDDAVGLAEHGGDAGGELALDVEQGPRRQRAVVGFAPEHLPVPRVQELRADPHGLRVGAHAALDDVGDPELAAQLQRVGALALPEARRQRIEPQSGEPHEVGDDLLGHAGGEEAVLLAGAERFEGQHDHGRAAGARRDRRGRAVEPEQCSAGREQDHHANQRGDRPNGGGRPTLATSFSPATPVVAAAASGGSSDPAASSGGASAGVSTFCHSKCGT